MKELRRTGRRRRVPVTLIAVMTLLAALLGSSAVAHEGATNLSLKQDIVGQGLTAADLADMGITNEPGTCGEEEGEVGWHFVTRGNGAHFDSANFIFGGDPYTLTERSGSQYTGDYLKGIYFATSPDATLDQALATGVSKDNQFVLSHVCVPETAHLKVTKFIDVDESGDVTAGDIVGGPSADLAGWQFRVYEGSDTSGTLIDTLTTDNTGVTPTIEVDPGTYTIEEVATGKTIGVNAAATVVTTVNPQTDSVEAGDLAEYTFGNACLITKHFQVTNVPAGTTGLIAEYDTTIDADTSGGTVVNLTDAGNGTLDDGIYQGTASETFGLGDQLEWSYGFAGDLAYVGSETFGSDDGYPDCERTNTVEFEAPSIEVYKFKDADDDGDPEDSDAGLEGWTIQLYAADGTTLLDEKDTDVDGRVIFEDLAPGTYEVAEVQQTNWVQTYPSNRHTVTVGIGDDVTKVFLNSPESEIRVGFTDLTGYTNVHIECVDANGDTIMEYDSTDNLFVEEPGTEVVDLDDIIRISQSEVNCSFEIVDP